MITNMALCVAALALGSGPDAHQGPQSKDKGAELLQIERNILQLTNAERARYKLPALEVSPRLMESARKHGIWMATYRSMVHSGGPVAENIAMGYPHSTSAVRAWMNSSGHRANILNSRHRHIGVAAYRTPSGTIYWCQQFLR